MIIAEAIRDGEFLKLKTNSPDSFKFVYGFKPGEYAIAPAKKKRSNDANAYCFALIDKISAATKIPKTEVYRKAIKEIGGNSEIVCVKTPAVQKLRSGWERNGLGWQTDEFPSKIDGCTNVILYYGSSVYDPAQMSSLIDNIVQDCKSLGIETLTEKDLSRIKEEWANG